MWQKKKKKDWTGSSVEWTEDEKSGLGKLNMMGKQ